MDKLPPKNLKIGININSGIKSQGFSKNVKHFDHKVGYAYDVNGWELPSNNGKIRDPLLDI